jgi:hypothetical protein
MLGMKDTVLVIGTAVVALVFSACSTPEQEVEKAAEKVEKAVEDVCADIDALGVALGRYGGIDAETPVAEVRSATAEVDRAWAKLDKRLDKLDRAEAKALDATYDEFQSVVESIPDTDTLGEASVEFVAALEDMLAKQDALQDLQCPE